MVRPLAALLLVLAFVLPARAQESPKKKKPAKPPLRQRIMEKPAGQEPKSEIKPPQTEFPTETAQAGAKDETPWIVRWMIKPIRRGMLIRLPIMDTDPNRGITGGVMPIWVIQEIGGSRIEHIHAPSLTYNSNFGWTPTYRYYFYPATDATVMARTSVGKYEREAMAQYEDRSILGTNFDFYGRLQYNVDASRRFFGLGPDTSRNAESSYKEDYLMYRFAVGHPVWRNSPVRVRVSDRLISEKVGNGPLPGIPGIDVQFPSFASERRRQSHEMGAAIEYDTRDHEVTTTNGMYALLSAARSPHNFGSMYDYSRFGLDLRWFKAWESKPTVTAAMTRYEQVQGVAPFWLMPQVGGKYSLRAYGEGRYVDRGSWVANLEQRFKLFEKRMAGVTTEFELAPFVGAGTVFDTPGKAHSRFVRYVAGGAVRAVARPQVVGSVDFGVGREGLAAFMDINYSF